jgi:hypothetical protein
MVSVIKSKYVFYVCMVPGYKCNKKCWKQLNVAYA